MQLLEEVRVTNKINSMVKAIKRLNIPGIFWGVIFLIVLFSILHPGRFLSVINFTFIARSSAVLILAGIGMTCAILVSQVDLSIGSVMSLAGVIAAVLMTLGVPLALSIAIALGAGVLVGLCNGVLIAVLKFDFWIVSFSTMGVCAGLALVVASGATVPVRYVGFDFIGNRQFGPFHVMVYLTVVMVILMQFILTRTKFGHKVYAIGGSEQSAKLSGIPVVRNRVYIYMISGFFAAMAGIVLASMGSAASPIAGVPYSFEAIAAVIIGGTTFDGGKGGLIGTVLGALLLRILASGLNLMGTPATWQEVIIGFVILLVIVVDVLNRKRNKRNDLRRRYT